jgi:arginase
MAAGVTLIAVPYDSGRRAERMGRGPDALLATGLADRLRRQGRAVAVERVEAGDAFPLEIGTAFGLARRIAAAVRSAGAAGYLPVVLAGNCISAVGTLAGLAPEDVGVAWFDCHGDFHTPETTPSGFLDGMALAAVTGRCWAGLAAGVPGFRPAPAGRVVHLAGRAFDPGEREAMARAGVAVHDADSLRDPGSADVTPADWAGLGAAYVHIDLDALDATEAPANGYQAPGGLSVAAIEGLLRRIGSRTPIRAAAVTAYDPAGDAAGRAAAAAVRLVECLTEVAAEPPTGAPGGGLR